jgi:hypothetical protein
MNASVGLTNDAGSTTPTVSPRIARVDNVFDEQRRIEIWNFLSDGDGGSAGSQIPSTIHTLLAQTLRG